MIQLIPAVLKMITNGKVPNEKLPMLGRLCCFAFSYIYFFMNYIPGTFFKLLLFCISINEGNPPPHDDNFWKSLNDISNDNF